VSKMNPPSFKSLCNKESEKKKKKKLQEIMF